MHQHLRRGLGLSATALLTATALVACGSSDSSNSASDSDDVTIRIGTTDSSKRAWAVFEDLAAENGITLDIVNFSDYSTPNQALAQDQLDVNLFQHLMFLSQHNHNTGDNLTPVGATEVVPLALFWRDHDSLDGIEGQEIAIPNDPTNQGRALHVLAQADLITLTDEKLIMPTPADIDTTASKVKVIPVDAAQTTAAYGEGRPAIINNSFLDRANIDPQLAIFHDDPESEAAEPYINAFVTKPEDKDDENILKLVELWHSPEVQAAVDEDSRGTSVAVQRTADELATIMERLAEYQAS